MKDEVIAPGSKVQLCGEIEAVVLSVRISECNVTYEVAWWDKRTRNSAWVHLKEISGWNEERRIGFK